MSDQFDDDSLLPCPFCGAKARFDYGSGIFAICGSCGASTDNMAAQAGAVAAWNKRVPVPLIPDHLMLVPIESLKRWRTWLYSATTTGEEIQDAIDGKAGQIR